jgi:hypothetical protein
MRLVAQLTCAFALTVLVAGCGDDGGESTLVGTPGAREKPNRATPAGPGAATPAEEREDMAQVQAAEATVVRIWNAVETQDWPVVCELLAGRTVKAVEKSFGTSCVDGMSQNAYVFDAEGEVDYSQIKIIEASVTGNTAAVEWELEGDTHYDTLLLEGNTWKLEATQVIE